MHPEATAFRRRGGGLAKGFVQHDAGRVPRPPEGPGPPYPSVNLPEVPK